MDDCTGKVVLITGAASGCGQAIARDLAARGAKVVVNNIDADVSEEDEVARLVDGTVDRFGALSCSVNNAGTEFAVDVEDGDTRMGICDAVLA